MPKDDRPHTLTRTNTILHTSSTYPCIYWHNSCAITGTHKGIDTRANSCNNTTTSCLRPFNRSFDIVVRALTDTLYHSGL
jgi:hypothetical protein